MKKRIFTSVSLVALLFSVESKGAAQETLNSLDRVSASRSSLPLGNFPVPVTFVEDEQTRFGIETSKEGNVIFHDINVSDGDFSINAPKTNVIFQGEFSENRDDLKITSCDEAILNGQLRNLGIINLEKTISILGELGSLSNEILLLKSKQVKGLS